MGYNFALSKLIEEQSGGLPWWAWVLILILFILLLAWIVRNWASESVEKAAPAKPPVEQRTAQAVKVEAPAPVTSIKPDDLTIIEGIGPKIDTILKQAGIKTLAQLGNTPAAKIEQIIRAAGIRLGDPTTWPEQARLATKGDLKGLKKLQDSLKGGRRA